jgi:hypothetical protein
LGGAYEVRAYSQTLGRQVLQVFFETAGRRRVLNLLTLPWFANHRELAEAIIEAAYRSNPDLRLNGLAQVHFGLPPYGVFEPGEELSPVNEIARLTTEKACHDTYLWR